jgi:hypothetical protein
VGISYPILTIICGLHDITSGHITMDWVNALKQTSSSKNPEPGKPAMISLVDLGPTPGPPRHTLALFKGHQDDDILLNSTDGLKSTSTWTLQPRPCHPSGIPSTRLRPWK